MTKRCLTNPQSFVKEAHAKGVRYEYLQEASKCIGNQKIVRMFKGKSSRGSLNSLSSATLQNWFITFEYVQEHPNEEDKDPYQARAIEPTQEWFDYVTLIKSPIPQDVVDSWENLSNQKLGDEALKYGITIGIRNGRAIKTLHQRMYDMIERRREKIWNTIEEPKNQQESTEEEPNYRMMNMFKLHSIAQSYGIAANRLKKEEIICRIQKAKKENLTQSQEQNDYEKLTSRELKNIAKDMGFISYNNLKKTELIKMIVEHNITDNEEEIIDSHIIEEPSNLEIKEYSLELSSGKNFIIPIREDGMVNATALCKAGNKKFADWKRLKETKKYLTELNMNMGIPILDLIQSDIGGNYNGTWIHRKVAYHLAQWISPKFSVQVSNWLDQLLTTGEVKLQRPVKPLLDMSQIDIEAEILEKNYDWSQYTNSLVLYIAYIGNGLLKIGSSDSRLLQREIKHTSCESPYSQFRILKTFKISSRTMETTIHELLTRYRMNFGVQKEIYKPPETLEQFINNVKNLVDDHDLKLKIEVLKEEILELRRENTRLHNLIK